MFATVTVADELLPLRPVVFGILLVLRAEPLHGYAIMKRVNEHLGSQALLGPGTLYRTLKELRDLDLLEAAAPPPGEDARRHYYELSDLGRQVSQAEAERIAGLMRASQLGDLVSESKAP